MTDVATTDNGLALEDLSEDEGRRLMELERQIDKAMRSAGRIGGAALLEIRDRKLYRASHRSFEAYCIERLGFSRATAYRMIDVARGDDSERESAGQHVSPRDISPEARAIGQASAKAAQRAQEADARRHTTLDQPPETIQPPHEPLERTEPPKPAPEPEEDEPQVDILRGMPEHNLTPPPLTRMAGAGAPTRPVRAGKLEARQALNRLLAVLDANDAEVLAAQATKAERIRVTAFAAAFRERPLSEEDQIDPKDCPHPANRRLGDVCGRCGARKKAKP